MGETDEEVNAKVKAVLEAGLIPIVCCGESLEQRESGITEEWITMQIKLALAGIPEDKIRKVVIAYEPIWAIGTGRTATPEQAEEVCESIRTMIPSIINQFIITLKDTSILSVIGFPELVNTATDALSISRTAAIAT